MSARVSVESRRARFETNHGLISMRSDPAVQLSRENVKDSQDDDRSGEANATKETSAEDRGILGSGRFAHDVPVDGVDTQTQSGWSIHQDVDEEDLGYSYVSLKVQRMKEEDVPAWD